MRVSFLTTITKVISEIYQLVILSWEELLENYIIPPMPPRSC